jgi:hypothetical protein
MDKLTLIAGMLLGGGSVIAAWIAYNIGYIQGMEDGQDECDEHEALGHLIFGDDNIDILEYPHGKLDS